MKNFYSLLIILMCSSAIVQLHAQDLRINRIDNLPDSSLFSASFTSRIYFQFASGSLSAPFTVYFNYSVNGIVQPEALDSFVYTSAITTEIFKDVQIRTNAPVYRKGDNIVVVWPICYQASHSANYYRKVMFVNDSTHTAIENNSAASAEEWSISFSNEDKKLRVDDATQLDFPLQLSILDASGRQVYAENMNRQESQSMPAMSPGIYFFELINKSKRRSGRLLIY